MADSGGGDTVTCRQCHGELPSDARFCPACGTPAEASEPREARKTVTLLFTDVTGSTALGEQLDPEAYRQIMGRYFDLAREAVERHGGTVEKFVGDAVLAVFGVPEVREDDALRAVRAAHDLDHALSGLSDELAATSGVRLEVRTGINTGGVIVGSARAGGSFATGDAVNTAARLEQAAPPGGILIGAETLALVRDAVEVEAVDPVLAKGKSDPVAAYRLLSVLAERPGRARRMGAALVGRDRETRVLDDALARTVESGRSHLVTVLGAPGIGKSRLVADFLARIGDRAGTVSGRCVSYGQGITYWPLVQALRQALHLSGDESDELTRHALSAQMADAADAERVVELLLPLLGRGGDPGAGQETVWAVRRMVESLASARPLVLSIDDLHWAEPTLLDLLEQVREEVQDLPVLLVYQARPELLDAHPGWGGGSLNSTTFALEPFTVDQTRTSMAALLGRAVPEEVARQVSVWAGGNPLFVEEIATHLTETGVLVREGESWRLTGDLESARVPPTVSALLSARMDRLPDEERVLLERVSVVGLELTTDEALALAPEGSAHDEVVDALTSLGRRDLLRRVRGPDGDSWAFKHVMVRDAAYDALPKAARADLHLRFAARLEGSGAVAGSERTAFVAHHLERAARLRRELSPRDPDTDELTLRAARSLATAAEEARDRDDVGVARALLEQAIDLRPPTPARRRLQGRLAYLLTQTGEVAAAGDLLGVLAREVTTDRDATELERAVVECQRQATELAAAGERDPGDALAAAERAAALARDAGDRQLLSQALSAALTAWVMRGRWVRVGDVCDELVQVGTVFDRRYAAWFAGGVLLYGPADIAEIEGWVRDTWPADPTPRHVLRARGLRALIAAGQGLDGAIDEITSCLDASTDLDDGRTVEDLNFHAMAYVIGGADRLAITTFARAADACRVRGDRSHLSTIALWQALLMLQEHDPLDAIRPLVDEAAATTSPYDTLSVSWLSAASALIEARDGGDLDRSARLATEAIRVGQESDQVWHRADLGRWLSEISLRRGELAQRRAMLEGSLAIYRMKGLWVQHRRTAELLTQEI
ncbi:AAA family ATPase [Nocardioides mangrovi]|uniref:AAA family ATPase n=1 Tax=Nocardioides mangrovi TaxID=2874580 RepID=A0ABS7U832_9ACTN|nr:adenylate/guanylate cyclase domain-containing protein [Nocardioides mangrovi]MBZ5736982.1 AAA family ATPase [Nocardioides mangrovi]